MNFSRSKAARSRSVSPLHDVSLTLPARAKINLHLRALEKRPDGYTEIVTIFQTVSLSDVITFRAIPSGIRVTCSHPEVPTDDRNLAYKASQLFFESSQIPAAVHLHIEKRIPIEAGLGGGSSDAATVLHGLNDLHGVPLNSDIMMQLASRIGSDVPFFLYGGTALGRGRGEIIDALPDLHAQPVVIVYPGYGISTREAYKMSSPVLTGSDPDISIILRELKQGHLNQAARFFTNDLERNVVGCCPDIQDVRNNLKRSAAFFVMMTGSGSACFGLYHTDDQARAACRLLAGNKRWKVFKASFIPRSSYWGVVKR